MKMTPGKKFLVDTNVLLEATDAGRPLHDRAIELFRVAPARGADLLLATQNLREYLVVATRPVANNGLEMPMPDALENLCRFRRRAAVVGESLPASERFLRWAAQFELSGKRLHDLQILATSVAAGMDGLITANPRDFPDTGEIKVISLAELSFEPG